MTTNTMDLKVIEKVQKFSWNYEAVKAELEKYTENFVGLVVNDENLKDMEKAQREVASDRIRIGKFKLAVKHDLEKPYLDFEEQIKNLLKLVESVEKPIKDQLDKYEIRRREEKTAETYSLIAKISDELGLEETYRHKIAIADKWLNRTQKFSDTKEDIQMQVVWLLDVQKQDQDAAKFQSEKIEMAKFLCESLSVGMATPLTFAEIENRIDSFDISGLRKHIEGEVARRKEREERAAQQAIERAERQRLEAEQRAERERIAEAQRQVKLAEQERVAQSEAVKVEHAPVEKLWNVQCVMYGITEKQFSEVAEFIKSKGIELKTAAKPAKEGAA